MTTAKRIRQEGLNHGLEKGLQQGLEKGLELGRVQTLRRLLELRFGRLTQLALKRLETADGVALDRYTERFVTASSIEDVFER